MRSKLETIEEEEEEESTKLVEVSSKLLDFDHGKECNKLWISALKEPNTTFFRGARCYRMSCANG